MAKAKLITRQETTTTVTSDNFNKGSELSFAEADSNFLNLRDTTFGVVGDDSATIQIGMDSTLYIQGGDNVTTSTNSDGSITINSTASGSTGDLTISTSVVNGEDTVRLEVPGSHDLELNAGTGGGPGGVGDRLIQLRDRVQFHEALGSDGSNGNLHFAPNGNGLIQHYTAQTGYTFPKVTGDEAGKVLVMGGIDGSSVNALGFADPNTLFTAGDLTFTGSTINSPSNADITLDPSGTGVINNNATVRFNTNYKEDITALSSGTSIAVDCSLASVFSVTLAHNATFTFNNLATGQSASVIITQDGSGSRTGAYTSVLFPGNAHTLSTGAADIDIVSIFNDGTSLLGNISKDYS